MLTIQMLPAGRGDCLWIEYGDAKKVFRLLIDGGVASTGSGLKQRLLALSPDDRTLDRVIVTHIDLDHIGGILELLRDPPAGLQIGDLWFNGWDQLVAAGAHVAQPGILGPKQGEAVSFHINRLGLSHNTDFGHGPIMRKADIAIPRINLPGGMSAVILGPTPGRLEALRPQWKSIVEELGLIPGQAGQTLEAPDERPDVAGVLGDRDSVDAFLAQDYVPDTSKANGTSIAVMLEYERKRILCTGDAFAEDMTEAIGLMARASGVPKLQVDLTKVSHHGGKKNISVPLVQSLRCRNWLISSDGSYYQHPHGEALARIVRYGGAVGEPRLLFNYNSDHNALWRQEPRQRTERYSVVCPDQGREGLKIDMAAL